MNVPAYQHNGQPCTREAFYAIACDPRRSVAVEACAGAGKTWMLVSRILRALLEGAAPEEILAITFTRKAAGEMRQRLQDWLADFASARPDEGAEAHAARLEGELIARGIGPQRLPEAREALRNLYQTLLAHGRPVEVRTFHGWFAALLRSAPLQVLQDLGLPPAYELLEDTSDAVAELWRRSLRLWEADAPLRADYAALVVALGRGGAQQALERALAQRVEFALADAAGHVEGAVASCGKWAPRFAALAQPADALLRAAPGRALLLAAADALAPLARSYAAKGAELRAALDAGDWPGVVAALFTQAGAPRSFGKHGSHADIRAAQDEVQAVLEALRQHEAHAHHQRVLRLLRPMVAEFALLKQERGWIDMGDVERAALTLLGDPFLSGWVQQRLDARVRHLLIDEFQDTSPLQWQALHAWLAAYAGAGGGQAAPSVFIVGDPKQSIYRFRRADPRVFAAAQAFVAEALGGELLACDHTRRNAPAVLAAVNTVMGAAREAGEFEGFRPHTTESADAGGQVLALPLIARPAREAGASAPGADAPAWRDSLAEPRVALEDSLRTLECRQAARWIRARIDAGVPATDIMVLSRTREPLGELQAELRRLGVPCEQPEAQNLAALPVVQDVLALVDALVSPGHDLSLARALKSPLFGLADADLAQLARAARRAQRPGGARPAWLDLLSNTELETQDGQALHADLMLYQQGFARLPPHDALQALYSHRDVLARFAAAALPPEREHQLAQLRALLGAALQWQGGRQLTAYQWLRALRRHQVAAPRHAVPDSVRLLTVHGAKGLEADVVLLLGSAADPAGRGGGPAVLVDWPGAAPEPARMAFLANAGAPPPSLQALAGEEAAAQAREELNALYVAMTRARRCLVISGVEPYHAPARASWWQRIAPHATALADSAEAGDAPGACAGDGGSAGAASAANVAPGNGFAARDEAVFSMLELPSAPVSSANTAIETAALAAQAEAPPSEASRIGQAMHWLLEHAGDTPEGWRAERVAQAMRRFAVDTAQAAQAEALARRIRGGEAAWAWDAAQVIDAFDEVELLHDGQRLRIDRLVRRRAGAHGGEAWWVLDYKSAAAPERDALLRGQLARYRAALQRAHPGAEVRAAFLMATGAWTELRDEGTG